jgi:hypothetical protein
VRNIAVPTDTAAGGGSRSVSGGGAMRYVDVFVSHKLEDKQKAERLAA